MPNWCSNNIKVLGKAKNVKQFVLDNFRNTNKNEEYLLDFEQFDPTPLDETTGDVFDDWYFWRLEHWGCKWSPSEEQIIQLTIEYDDREAESIFDSTHPCCDEKVFSEEFINSIDEEDNHILKLEIQCYCETPWGPPEGIFNQWYDKYKETGLEISLKFYEPGCDVLGELWFSGEEYCTEFKDSYNRKEWVGYLLKEGWEDVEWFIEDCSNMIEKMEKEEVSKVMIPKIEEMLNRASIKQATELIVDIQEKYFKWLKGDNNEQSEK